MARRSGLGRGLSALIPTDDSKGQGSAGRAGGQRRASQTHVSRASISTKTPWPH